MFNSGLFFKFAQIARTWSKMKIASQNSIIKNYVYYSKWNFNFKQRRLYTNITVEIFQNLTRSQLKNIIPIFHPVTDYTYRVQNSVFPPPPPDTKLHSGARSVFNPTLIQMPKNKEDVDRFEMIRHAPRPSARDTSIPRRGVIPSCNGIKIWKAEGKRREREREPRGPRRKEKGDHDLIFFSLTATNLIIATVFTPRRCCTSHFRPSSLVLTTPSSSIQTKTEIHKFSAAIGVIFFLSCPWAVLAAVSEAARLCGGCGNYRKLPPPVVWCARSGARVDMRLPWQKRGGRDRL